jgi:hypothetical protein
VGTTLIAQWPLPFTAAVSVLRYRHPFQPCHPERNFVIGKANDKVESKDPMFVDTTPGNARRSHRAIIGWVDQPLRVLCARACPVFAEAPSEAEGGVEEVGTTLIAQWVLPFTPRVRQMSAPKIKIRPPAA